MATIFSKLNAFKALDTDDVIQSVMEKATEPIADQQVQQMFQGIKKDESDITPQYAPLTIEIKKLKGQPTDRVTLRDTNAFYQGTYARIEGEKVKLDSTDPKSKKLKDKYGEDIFGLSNKHRREVLNDTVKPLLKTAMEEKTGLKMK